MPYKIPNTFQMQTPLGQSVSNLISTYANNLPTPADEEKSAYMKAQTGAANARAQLDQQKLNSSAALGDVFTNIMRAQQPTTSTVTTEGQRPAPSFVGPEPGVDTTVTTPGASYHDAMSANYPAYVKALAEAGGLAQAGDLTLASTPWAPNSTTRDMDLAGMGAKVAYGSTQGGSLQHENFETSRNNATIAGANSRNAATIAGESDRQASSPLAQGGATGALVHELMKSRPDLYPTFDRALYAVQTGFRQGTGLDQGGSVAPMAGVTTTKTDINQAEKLGAGRGETMAKRESALPQAAENLRSLDNAVNLTNKTADDAAGMANSMTTGWVGSLAKAVPGSAAYNLAAKVGTLQSNATINALQEIRASSPTGGALGAVSDYEDKMLASKYANLTQSQSKEQFLANLQQYKEQVAHSVNNVRQAYTDTYGNTQGFDKMLTGQPAQATPQAGQGMAAQPGGLAPMTKVLNGVTYVNPTGQPNDWHTQ